MPEILAVQEALQPLAESLVLLALVLLGGRIVVGYVARFAAWVDSGFTWSPGPVTTGPEGMLQRRGVTRTALEADGEVGKVRVGGELWNAVASETVPPGEEVEVIAVEGLTLRVVPYAESQALPAEPSSKSASLRTAHRTESKYQLSRPSHSVEPGG